MNRKDRRDKKRNDKKSESKKVEAMKWFRTLPHEKAILVDSYARMLANRDNEYFINALERCYSAAIVNQLDLDWG
ncbi:MAG: hypothetical protein ACRC7S_14660, partial [Cetobacterium sp.]